MWLFLATTSHVGLSILVNLLYPVFFNTSSSRLTLSLERSKIDRL